jgi:hypothetical protein
MKPNAYFRIVLLALVAVVAAADGPARAQGPSCYVSPSMERTYIFVRELDSDGNPKAELGGRWVDFGAQAPVTSSTGSIAISYRPSSSDREILMDPESCSGGNVISVP